MGGSVELSSREYKLLLDPRHFRGAPSEARAGKFWTRRLVPIICDSLDLRGSRQNRAKGELKLKKQRIVQFRDTGKHLLYEHGFALRSRVFVENGALSGDTEVTLKFRTTDVLLAAEFRDASRNLNLKKKKFEEDIAPLQIGPGNDPGKKMKTTKKHLPYSRFSVSLYREFDDRLRRLGDAFDQFGTFEDELEDARAGKVKNKRKLDTGPTICEWVFQDAFVDLGDDLDAEFGFTLWYLVKGGVRRNACKEAASGALDPLVAEISFSLDTKDGRVPAPVSRRAMRLFTAMQEALPVNRRATSKTMLALPPLR